MSATPPTLYDVMGLAQTATQVEVKKRYRELARSHHPDVAKSPESANQFREINEANSILSDPARRANYDAELILKARLSTPPKSYPNPPKARKPANPPTKRPT